MRSVRNYSRRIVFVQRAFQIRYATIVAALFAFSALIVGWESYQGINKLYDSGLIVDPEVMIMVKHIARAVLIKLLLAEFLVWILAILLSHYIAGPVYRVQRGLSILKSGDLTHRISLRKYDQMSDLASEYNGTVESLRRTIQSDRTRLEIAIRKLEESNAPEEIIDRLRGVGKSLKT